MATSPKVSIGLPFYNAGSTLSGAIRSVFAQTYNDWELILVDDGSSDGSYEIAREVKDPRVRLVSDGCNRGLPARLNEIVAAARGSLVARMDADDLMHPERLAQQIAVFDERRDVDIVGTATYTTDADWHPLGMRGLGPLDTRRQQVLRHGLFIHPTVTARTAWMRANPYRPDLLRAEDFELWCRTCSSISAVLLPQPLHFYREPVPINLRSYLDTCRTSRAILRDFASRTLGRRQSIELLLRLRLKEFAYRLSGPLRFQSWLVRRRSRRLTTVQREAAQAALQTVLATEVPGFARAPDLVGRETTPITRSRTRLLHATTVPMTLRFLHGQLGFMQAQGMEVVAMSSPGADLDELCHSQDVGVCAVRMERQITPGGDLWALLRIWRHLRRLGPDIVHAHTPKCGMLVTLAAWLARVPVRVYHIHGLPLLTATGIRQLLLRWSERVTCRFATQVLCVSHSVRQVVVERGLCPAGKIKVLGGGTINGVDAIGRFNPANLAPNVRHQIRTAHGIPEHALVVGFVGRVVRDKGMADLVDAWAALRARFPSLHLLVVGPLESGDPIPEDTRRVLTTDTRIHLTGLEWDTPPLYAAMDLVVLPSYREGFPTVPLEAAAMELPVVSTRVPGCVDAVLEGRTGMLAEPHHVATLTELIAGYLSDPDLRRRHGQAGREWVLRDFKQEVIWQAVWGEYVRLLNEVGMPLQAPAYPHDKLAIPHLAPEGS